MLHITAIPAFDDNYFWLLTERPVTTGEEPQYAYIVDPGDGAAVQRVLQAHQLILSGILITHRHHDHIGGVNFLCEQHSQGLFYKSADNTSTNADIISVSALPVYGPSSDAIQQVTHAVYEGDSISLFDKYSFSVLETPGHTPEHIVYFSEAAQDNPVLFCGDTLFAAGCGRLLGGSAEQLHQSLQRLANLPDNTQVYCAHEYTLANLRFAQAVEPHNLAVKKRIQSAQRLRNRGQATVPFELKGEHDSNPFLRTHSPDVKTSVQQHCRVDESVSDSETFTQLRRWKDSF